MAKRGFPRLDLDEAVDILTEVKFTLSTEAMKFWEQGDGLPRPNDPEFAKDAARFVADNPIAPAERTEPTIWSVRKTASRQLKCLAYLAEGKPEHRLGVASLCAVQATRLHWTLPIRTAQLRSPDRTFYAATSSLMRAIWTRFFK